jgi:hypothetical protein
MPYFQPAYLESLDYCGFFEAVPPIGSGVNNSRTCTVSPFTSGPFGRFYLNDVAGGGNLLRGDDASPTKGGTGTASENGVYHRTVDPSASTGEGSGEVSIGYHYPPHPQPDFDGNGVADVDEDTDGDGLPDAWELEYELNPLDSTLENGLVGDPDSDGFINQEEFELCGSPKSPAKSGEQLVRRLLECNNGSSLRVEIEDSVSCEGDNDDDLQWQSVQFDVGPLDDDDYLIAVTVKGLVDCLPGDGSQNGVYDIVCIYSYGSTYYAGARFFASGAPAEEMAQCDDCVMVEKECERLIQVKNNGMLELEYYTNYGPYHLGAYAEITAARIVKVGLEGYEAWRGSDGDKVPNKEEKDPGFLITQNSDPTSFDPFEAKLNFKALPADFGLTRWIHFAPPGLIELRHQDESMGPTIPGSSMVQIPGPIDQDFIRDIAMSSSAVWTENTSVTIEYIIKNQYNDVVFDDSVRVLRPVLMSIGDSLTFGFRRRSDGTCETPRWYKPWTNYPTDFDWASVPGFKDDPDFQGWRGYLFDSLHSFAWKGENPNGHGPNHMGYSGARTTDIVTLLEDTSRYYPIEAFKSGPCYAIVIYFIGLNDIVDGRAATGIYTDWESGLNKLLGHRASRGKTLVVKVTLPKIGANYHGYTSAKERELISLNWYIRGHRPKVDHVNYAVADVEAIEHDKLQVEENVWIFDDGLHFFDTGYGAMMSKIQDAIRDGLKQ